MSSCAVDCNAKEALSSEDFFLRHPGGTLKGRVVRAAAADPQPVAVVNCGCYTSLAGVLAKACQYTTCAAPPQHQFRTSTLGVCVCVCWGVYETYALPATLGVSSQGARAPRRSPSACLPASLGGGTRC